MEVPEWVRKHRMEMAQGLGAIWSLGVSVLLFARFF